jgi:hypothetical protein
VIGEMFSLLRAEFPEVWELLEWVGDPEAVVVEFEEE